MYGVLYVQEEAEEGEEINHDLTSIQSYSLLIHFDSSKMIRALLLISAGFLNTGESNECSQYEETGNERRESDKSRLSGRKRDD